MTPPASKPLTEKELKRLRAGPMQARETSSKSEVKILRDALEKMSERYHDLSKASEHHETDSDYYVQTGINELADLARDILEQSDAIKGGP